MDLVQISPNAVPPVCKIMDYKKFLYEQKKREKQLKSKATKVVVKEVSKSVLKVIMMAKLEQILNLE